LKDIKRKIILSTKEFVLNNRNLETRGKRSIWQKRVQFWCQASLRVEARSYPTRDLTSH